MVSTQELQDHARMHPGCDLVQCRQCPVSAQVRVPARQQTRNSLGEELCSTIQLAHSTLLDGDPEAMLERFPTQLACPQSWSPRAMCILQVLVDGICFNVVLFGARLLIESSGPCNILNLAATSHVHTNGRHRDLLVVAVWLCSLR